MSIFNKLSRAVAKIQDPSKDEAFFEAVALELARDDIRPGLWAKAYSDASADADKARAIYIRLRVASLKGEVATALDVKDRQDAAKMAAQKSLREKTTLLISRSVENYDKGDFVQAIPGFEAAAAEGMGWAFRYLGHMHKKGEGRFPTNENNAMAHYQKAAELDDAEAMYCLGVLQIKNGNYEDALNWLGKAKYRGIFEAASQITLAKGFIRARKNLYGS